MQSDLGGVEEMKNHVVSPKQNLFCYSEMGKPSFWCMLNRYHEYI